MDLQIFLTATNIILAIGTCEFWTHCSIGEHRRRVIPIEMEVAIAIVATKQFPPTLEPKESDFEGPTGDTNLTLHGPRLKDGKTQKT